VSWGVSSTREQVTNTEQRTPSKLRFTMKINEWFPPSQTSSGHIGPARRGAGGRTDRLQAAPLW
jgi:hypothetical protein